jgi:hypothetical protein
MSQVEPNAVTDALCPRDHGRPGLKIEKPDILIARNGEKR